MLVYNNSLFSIYFGNAQDNLYPAAYTAYQSGTHLLSLPPYNKLKKLLLIDDLLFLRQIHSDKGLIASTKDLESFKVEGDYLITHQKSYGLGVMTADCLPIIFYDIVRHIAAIAHVGWRGAMQQIAPKVLNDMQGAFGTDIDQLRIFFGPSIKRCCYEVGEEFSAYVTSFSFGSQVLHRHDNQLMFDLPLFNRLQLEQVGVAEEAFKLDYNVCTKCDVHYCSSRRKNNGRQMTVVAMH